MFLREKGLIGCAVEVLLLLQAGYARQEPGYRSGMVDAAVKALEREIDEYVEAKIKQYRVAMPIIFDPIGDMIKDIKGGHHGSMPTL